MGKTPLRLRYYGHFGQETGYGRAALEYALALHRYCPQVELDLRPMSSGIEIAGRLTELAGDLHRGSDPDLVLVHTLPRDCPKVLELENIPDAIPAIAYTTWEAYSFPQERWRSLDRFCRIFTPSRASARALEACDPGFADERPRQYRVVVIPHTFDAGELAVYRKKAELARKDRAPDDPFTFYYIGAANRRKNVAGLISAFAHIFADTDPKKVRLFLHCPGKDDAFYVQSCIAGTGLGDTIPIRVRTHPVSEDVLWAMHGVGDVFVSASHGEAWNLPAFEAFLMGRHIICPADEGSDDYLVRTSAWRYTTRLEPAFLDTRGEVKGNEVRITVTGPTGLTSREFWWAPDLRELGQVMHRNFADRRADLFMGPGVCDPQGRFETMEQLREHYSHRTVAMNLAQELEKALS